MVILKGINDNHCPLAHVSTFAEFDSHVSSKSRRVAARLSSLATPLDLPSFSAVSTLFGKVK